MTAVVKWRAVAVVRMSVVAGVMLLCFTGFLAGCKDVLGVPSPRQIIADNLTTPDKASLLVSGAQADFECALAGYADAGGLVADELIDTQQLVGRYNLDRRTTNNRDSYGSTACTNAALQGVYIPLATARWSADNAVTALQGFTDAEVPNRISLIATASAYAGYSLVLLGEGFCSVAIDAGPELTPVQVLTEAESRFSNAITQATASNNTNILNMALVGRARARLDLALLGVSGKAAAADADAKLVPASFRIDATYSSASTRRENYVFDDNVRFSTASIDVSYRDFTTNGVADPRVPVVAAATAGNDQTSPFFIQQKYTSVSSSIPLATGAEARLIVAEVEGGQVAVGIINALDAGAGVGGTPFASSDPAAIQDRILHERMAQFFLDGHRLGDVILRKVALAPATGTAFRKGGTYGSQVCFPLPNSETANNANIARQ